MHRRLISQLAALILLLAPSAFGGDEKPVDWEAVQADPERLVELLGDDSWNTREEAQRLLESLGRKALPAVRKALDSPDPEVAMRARILAKKIEEALEMGNYQVVLVSKNRESTLWSSKRLAVRGASGALYAAILGAEGVLNVVKTADGGATWQNLPGPGFTGVECKGFSMAVDSKERLHLVVHDHSAGDHFFLRSFVKGVWIEKERFSGEGLSGGRSPTVAVDDSDDVHVLWQAVDGETFFRKKTGAAWGAVEKLDHLGAQTCLEVDGLGRVHAVGGYDDGLRYRLRDEKGEWGPTESIDDEMSARHASLAVDAENRPHVVWTGEELEGGWKIYYCMRSKDRWCNIKHLSAEHGDSAQNQYHNPTVAVDAEGNVHVVFDGGKPDGAKFIYGVRFTKGSWSAQAKLTGPGAMVRNPQLRGTFWPESNRVKNADDLDLFCMEMKGPEFRVLYRRGIK